MIVRSPYNYDMGKVSKKTGLHCKDATLAQQHFKDEVDINRMVATYAKTGVMTQRSTKPFEDLDFVGITDYHSALNQVIAGQEAFDSLDSALRNRFDNDAGKFLDWFAQADHKQLDEAGLARYPYFEPDTLDESPVPEAQHNTTT